MNPEEFVAIIVLKPELTSENPELTPIFISRIFLSKTDYIERHAGTSPRNYKDKVNNIQTFHVSKLLYFYYNCVANFPGGLSDIEEMINY